MDKWEHLRSYLTPGKIGFVCQVNPPRLGVRAFIQELEYTHFPPLPHNDEFQVWCELWEEIAWAVVVIPKEKRHLADPILAKLGLRVADGVPHVITLEETIPFPVNQPNLFTLEHVNRHFAYRNSPLEYVKALEAEEATLQKGLDAMMARWEAIRPEYEAKHGKQYPR